MSNKRYWLSCAICGEKKCGWSSREPDDVGLCCCHSCISDDAKYEKFKTLGDARKRGQSAKDELLKYLAEKMLLAWKKMEMAPVQEMVEKFRKAFPEES